MLGADVNKRLTGSADRTISGPVLLTSVQSGNQKLTSFLLERLSANPNATVFIEGKPSTFIIFVLQFLPM